MEKDGKPIELVTARLKIDLSGELVTGYADYFGRTPWSETVLGRYLKSFYNRIFYRDLEYKQADALYYLIYDLQTGIKEKLNRVLS